MTAPSASEHPDDARAAASPAMRDSAAPPELSRAGDRPAPVEFTAGGSSDIDANREAQPHDDQDDALVLVADDLTVAGRTFSVIGRRGGLELFAVDDGPGAGEVVLALGGRYRPAAGTVRFQGRVATPAQLRDRVAVAQVVGAVEPVMQTRVAEHLDLCAALGGHRDSARSARIWGTVGLTAEIARRRLDELSPGDMVRVAVAGALLARPAVVVADRIDRGVAQQDWPGLVADLRAAADTTGVAILASSSRPAAEV